MTPANSRWPRTSTSMSSLAMTDADLGPRSSRASSPKYCPGPSLAISRFPRFTEALPSRMRKNSWPGLPSCTRTLPAGTSTSSDARAMVCSSFFEQAEKSGTLPRCSRYWSFFRSGMGRMITTPRRLVLMGVDLSTLVQRADTRIVLVVMDGLGGYATVERGSELEEAKTPNLDRLVAEGSAGLVEPVGPGITPGSGPGHLGLFGYDPLEYELGRGALSAAGLDVELKPGDVAARGNLATLDDDGNVVDRRAGRIPDDEAAKVVERLREGIDIAGVEVVLVPEAQHRVLVVLRGEGLDARVTDTDPQATGVPPVTSEAKVPDAERTADVVGEL